MRLITAAQTGYGEYENKGHGGGRGGGVLKWCQGQVMFQEDESLSPQKPHTFKFEALLAAYESIL